MKAQEEKKLKLEQKKAAAAEKLQKASKKAGKESKKTSFKDQGVIKEPEPITDYS